MKKQLIGIAAGLYAASSAMAVPVVRQYSDADFWISAPQTIVDINGAISGGQTHSGTTPNGIKMAKPGSLLPGVASVSGSFNFVSDSDGTSFFTQSYNLEQVGTWSSIDGYVPGTKVDVNSVYIAFWVRDDSDPNTLAGKPEHVHITAQDFFAETGNNATGFGKVVLFQSGGSVLINGDIEDDGTVNYIVEAINGDFYLDSAWMGFNIKTADGGAMSLLLGSSLLVGAGLRRRFGVSAK